MTGCKDFACAIAISATQVEAIEWEIRSTIAEPISKSLAHIRVRAHQITFLDSSTSDNLEPWLVVNQRSLPLSVKLESRLILVTA